MGPIALYDKSFLQSLSTDESVWFDNFFYPVTSPLFYIETLADLWKKPRSGKSPEDEVGIIAAKTPQLHGGPCYFHLELCVQDLMGNFAPMTGQIPMAGMRRVFRDGKEGAIAEVSEEAKAFQRWRLGDFYDVERLYARRWRTQVESINLDVIERSMKKIGITAKTCKSMESAIKFADEALSGLTKTPARFDGALEVLGVPSTLRLTIKNRWKNQGKPPLRVFAPYAAHMLRVELFFRVALGANLIASTRPSHQIDMAYLFYLPFCMIFISCDKLHRQCAPFFMRPDQQFVWGHELKEDLGALNTYYSALPDEIKLQGIFSFAKGLPEESQGIIRKLFERYSPNLLKPTRSLDPKELKKTTHKKIMEDIKQWEAASSRVLSTSDNHDLETLIIKRSVSRMRGSWLQFGPEVESIDRGINKDN